MNGDDIKKTHSQGEDINHLQSRASQTFSLPGFLQALIIVLEDRVSIIDTTADAYNHTVIQQIPPHNTSLDTPTSEANVKILGEDEIGGIIEH